MRSFSVKSYRLPPSLAAANYFKFVKTIHPFIPRGVGEIPKGSIFATLLIGRKLNTDVLLLQFFLGYPFWIFFQQNKCIIRVVDNYSIVVIVVCDVRSFSVKWYRLPPPMAAANYFKFVKAIHPLIPRGVGEISKGSIFATLLWGRNSARMWCCRFSSFSWITFLDVLWLMLIGLLGSREKTTNVSHISNSCCI